ncbi:MAG: ATP-dependent DNA helicase [Bdellovibrionales bacterium]|nr:ATP-dependent DNA helicase [Bdellovibrionales bacterium]
MTESASEGVTLKLSIRDFSVPCPRRGSIDSHSGYGRQALDGIEIHQEIQKRHAKLDPLYEAEVKSGHRFERDGYVIEVEGRLDGIFRHERPRIEEIKSTFNLYELRRAIEEAGTDHPYVRQLLTYGYFFWKETGVDPELTLHLVSSRNRETLDIPYALDVAEYEVWLELRLAELAEEAARIEKRIARRKKIAAEFPFPFEKPRTGQRELVATVEEGFAARKHLLLQAPTGLGKTVGVLYPSLREAMARGQSVIYVTPKNSQHSVAEDAIDRFQETGAAVKGLTLTAKTKICMKAEPLCNPSYCEYAKDYYTKVAEQKLLEQLAKKKRLSAKTFKKMAEDCEVCPFQLQIDALPQADVVIGDYNHVFSAYSALSKRPEISFAEEGKPNLVVDEAHNLPSRTMDYYSPALSSGALDRMREDMKKLSPRFARDGAELLDAAIQILVDLRPADGKLPARIDPPVDPFIELDGKLRNFLNSYLESDAEIQPRDVVLRFCFYWAQFTEMLETLKIGDHPEFFITYQNEFVPGGARDSGSATIKITCCDASRMIAPKYAEYENVVAFSATVKPFEYYAKLSGLESERLETREFESPFSPENRKLLLIPQISTKYSDRERNYGKIAETIRRVAEMKKGNYLAFFPSFDFMRRVAAVMTPPEGFRIVQQEREMRAGDVEDVLNDLRLAWDPTLLFAVQGGIFSEGVDYPGEMVIGAFVIGPPLPNFDIERETMRKYYDASYDGEGFEYAYSYPAMAKAVQAAGRVIRSETDRGVIVLMDRRFLDENYSKSMPGDWFAEKPHELVSRGILRDVAAFWSKGEGASTES